MVSNLHTAVTILMILVAWTVLTFTSTNYCAITNTDINETDYSSGSNLNNLIHTLTPINNPCGNYSYFLLLPMYLLYLVLLWYLFVPVINK